MTALRFRAELKRQRRGWLGFELPPTSTEFFGTRAQVAISVTVEGTTFRTLAFPTGDGRHYSFINADLRKRLGVEEGDLLFLSLERAPRRPPPVVPEALLRQVEQSAEAKAAWDSLSPSARTIASRWVGGAKSTDVREWRARDVIRRATRYFRGEGPFYPTKEDQKALSMPRPNARRRKEPALHLDEP
jgi:uncharacterized protein DUF1905/bacteriocin resistance YdeI/OmpD-like protein